MTSKRFYCFAIALTTAIASQAQNRPAIEISETDTILLNPTSIEYIVSATSTPDFSAMAIGQNRRGQAGKEKTPASMKTVMGLLRYHHIAWVATTSKEYLGSRYPEIGDSAITITVHSAVELQSVDSLLSPLSGITTKVGQIDYEPMPDRVSIYKKIYSQALADATGMAAVSGKSLGDLIAADEPQDPLWSMRQMIDMMEPTFSFVSQMMGNRPAKLQKKVEVKMFFKFELK